MTEPDRTDLDLASPAPPAAAPQAASAARVEPQRASLFALWAVAVIALGVALFTFFTRGQEVQRVAEVSAQRMAEAQAAAKEAQAAARAAQDNTRDALAKLSVLETRLAESQNQQVALERLYEELSRNRDEFVLIEVERMVELAAQQLQVAGNITGALAALQTADARLARADKPQYGNIRKVLARDIERLKAQPATDLTGLAIRLDALSEQVEQLPLLSEPRPVPEAKKAVEPGSSWWDRFSADVTREFTELVSIRKLSGNEVLLMTPDQARLYRDTLRLKLANARLALMARNQQLLRSDLARIDVAVSRSADPRSKLTQSFLTSLRTVGSATVAIEPPSLNETLSAIANVRAARN
ncbi:uroporphyrinogen-III C-methyltransferase [Piscinibacterium candidicorallinum]|uniref:Uroporphyrinogen-III C-methyltransferase n=1 Tax=Piscinibacterium candidicorallinum TaxID=1793872 RepID=A0ABV7H253_9BURK